MEHIVQFAVDIDDERIVKKVEEYAVKEITNNLQQQVANKLFDSMYYNTDARIERDPLSRFSESIIDSFFEKYKDIIIDKAAKRLADRLARTKVAKAILGDIEDANNAEIH